MTFQQFLYAALGGLLVLFVLMVLTSFVLWRRMARRPGEGAKPSASPFWIVGIGLVLFSILGGLTFWMVGQVKSVRRPVSLRLFSHPAVAKRIEQALLPAVLGRRSKDAVCSYALLGGDRTKERVFAYTWTVCGRYRLTSSGWKNTSGASLPVVVVMKEKDWRVEKVLQPGDGSLYVPSIYRLFPRRLAKKVVRFQVDQGQVVRQLVARNRALLAARHRTRSAIRSVPTSRPVLAPASLPAKR